MARTIPIGAPPDNPGVPTAQLLLVELESASLRSQLRAALNDFYEAVLLKAENLVITVLTVGPDGDCQLILASQAERSPRFSRWLKVNCKPAPGLDVQPLL